MLHKGKLNVYVSGGDTSYLNWLPFEYRVVGQVSDSNLVFFTGGEDITPGLYKEESHKSTYSNIDRDMLEIKDFMEAEHYGIKKIGICRGAQLLCVLAGGRLVQDQNNPGSHLMKTSDGEEFLVTSTHHQAAYPFDMDSSRYKVLGWTENMLKYHKSGKDEEMNPPVECEVVFYRNIKALGIQPHPEMVVSPNGKIKEGYEEGIEWFRKNVIQLLRS